MMSMDESSFQCRSFQNVDLGIPMPQIGTTEQDIVNIDFRRSESYELRRAMQNTACTGSMKITVVSKKRLEDEDFRKPSRSFLFGLSKHIKAY